MTVTAYFGKQVQTFRNKKKRKNLIEHILAKMMRILNLAKMDIFLPSLVPPFLAITVSTKAYFKKHQG